MDQWPLHEETDFVGASSSIARFKGEAQVGIREECIHEECNMGECGAGRNTKSEHMSEWHRILEALRMMWHGHILMTHTGIHP